MANPTQKLHILVIQHLEHVGVGENVVAPLKAALEKTKPGEGSTLYELFCSATGEGGGAAAPKRGAAPKAAPAQQQAPAAQQQARGSVPAAAAARPPPMMQNVADNKPIIARPPEPRNPKLDEQLMAASKSGSPDTIPGLVTQGAYVNMQDSSGRTPLLAATEADKDACVKVLLQHGADVNLAAKDGTTPLVCAYKTNKKKVLKELTAGAFRTLNTAVHQTGNIGGWAMYDPGADEGITETDMVQLKDEVGALFHLQAHPEVPSPKSPVKPQETGPSEIGDLRVGGVKLLMHELCNVTHKP